MLPRQSSYCQKNFILKPPAWSEGQWWIMECQRYDFGDVVAGSISGVTPIQTWKFEVVDQKNIGKIPHYIVSIRPINENACPYWFRIWFRQSDRFVSRYELHHTTQNKDKNKNMTPKVVYRNFSDQRPFLSNEFPALPLTTPLFDLPSEKEFVIAEKNQSRTIIPGRHKKNQFRNQSRKIIMQNVKTATEKNVAKVARFKDSKKSRSYLREDNLQISMKSNKNAEISQIWNKNVPWCVYGKKSRQGKTLREYWLVEFGTKKHAPEE